MKSGPHMQIIPLKEKLHAVSTAAFAMPVIFVGFTAPKWR
jgi:hypothetical protein